MSGSLVVGLGRLGCRVVGLVAVWLLVVGGGSAWAATGHAFVGQFGGYGAGDGQFGEPVGNGPSGVAVMPSTGEVFTVDAGQDNPRVQRFGADGVFVSRFAIEAPYGYPGPVAAGPVGSGAVYVAAMRADPDTDPLPLGVVVKYGADGTFAGELDASGSGTALDIPAFSQASPVAVDPVDGTVYAAATDSNGVPVVDRFDGASGAFLGSFADGSSDGRFGCVSGLAVDVFHRVYVFDGCKGRVDRYGAGNVFEATLVLPGAASPFAVATDPVSGEVYVAHSGPVGTQITQFAAGGSDVVYTFDALEVGGVRAMAVSGAGTVYTSDASKPFVQRFTRFDGPTVVTGSASSVGAKSVVLEGTIDPAGVGSSYHFEYGTDQTFGSRSRTPDVAVDGGGGVVAASALVDGLQPNKAYVFRIVGSNDDGSIAGASGSFMTLTAPATVDGTSPPGGSPAFVSSITPRSARLHGTVNPNNAPFSFPGTSFSVQYGTTTGYGTTVVGAGPDLGGYLCGFIIIACGGVDQPVFVDVSGLEPGQTYHFRVVADNQVGGMQVGADQTFVTAPAAGARATDVTAGRATLSATINPHGVGTTYHFNYGATASYGASTPEVDGGSGDGERVVSQEISGLSSDMTYHVQVVATSADGVIRSSSDGLFRTELAPTAVAIGPTGVSTDVATLGGEVNTFGLTGSYHFDVWSLDSSYAISTPKWPVAGNGSAERVGAGLSGLPAGETFVVQLSVSSNDAVGVSDLITFATAEVPRVFPPSPAGDGVYGCGAPRLNAVGGRPKPGETITIAGRDLGVGGNVTLGDRALEPVDWSVSGFKVVVPEDAAGTLALTVNCGRRSNTVAVAVFQEPENGFAVTGRSVAGSIATLRVRVPGPGKLESSGSGTRAVKVTVKKPGTATIKVRLTSSAARALSRAASYTRRVRVRFTPAGGRSASKTVTITFKRKGGR